jgi:tRNA (adenine37-N6)-methyltransferase
VEFSVVALGWVRTGRVEAVDDDWGNVVATIELDPAHVDQTATAGLEAYSHIEVIYLFHLVTTARQQTGARHPRNNPDWPEVGILAQRAKGRPNRLGLTACELVAVDGLTLMVRGLDAIVGTPVLDIKPYMAEFAPRGPITQPDWSHELMTNYWH